MKGTGTMEAYNAINKAADAMQATSNAITDAVETLEKLAADAQKELEKQEKIKARLEKYPRDRLKGGV